MYYSKSPGIIKQTISNRILLLARDTCLLFSLAIGLLAPISVSGQARPSLLLEDLEENTLDIKCLCSPGVRNKSRSKGVEISYNLIGPGDLAATKSEFGVPYPRYDKFRMFRIRASYPVIRTPAFKMIVGVKYRAEQFEFQTLESDHQGILRQLDNENLKSTSFEMTLSYSLNEINYLAVKLKSQYNGGYSGFVEFEDRYSVYNAAVVFGIKRDEDQELGFGLAVSNNFRSSGFRVLPFVLWNKNFNQKWGLEAAFPAKVFMRYNLNSKSILLGGMTYNGESYSFDQDLINRQISFNHSEMQFLLKLERQIVPWVWFDIVGGYQANFDSNFEVQASQREVLNVSIDNSWYFRIGFFISPSDKFMRSESPIR